MEFIRFKRTLIKTPFKDKRISEQYLGRTDIIAIIYNKNETFPYSYDNDYIKSKKIENILKYIKSENGFGFKLEEIKE